MTVRFEGDWGRAQRVLRGGRQVRRVIDVVIRSEARNVRDKMVSGIRRQAPGGKKFKPLSPATLLSRRLRGVRGSRALMATGRLIRSISVKRAGDLTYFVGVPPKGSGSTDIAKIAAIQENGMGPVVIRITDKMRKFLHVLYNRTGDPAPRGGERRGFVVIRVPPRPFVRPTVEYEMAPSRAIPRICAEFAKRAGGDLGRT